MKNYIKNFAVVVTSIGAFFAFSFVAHAAISWNTLPGDCQNTVSVANHTTQQNASSPCWGPTVSGRPGEAINVRIDYDNVGDTPATNTLIHLNQPMGTQSTFNFTGFVSSNGVQKVGSASVVLSAPSTFTVESVYWYANQSGSYTVLNNSDIFGAGANLGTIQSSSTCPATNQRCHSGAVIVRFNVGNSNPNPTPTQTCTISTFRVNPTSISSGSNTFVIWNTQNCASVSVTGPGVSDTRASGYAQTPNLTQNTTYTITGRSAGIGSVPVTQTATVSVAGAPVNNCAITDFRVSPTSVSSGSSASVIWSTSNCTNVTVSGPGVSSRNTSGNLSTPALYSSSTYTISASGSNGSAPSQSATVYVNATPASCSIVSFEPSNYTVSSGTSATLSWSTANCTSVSMSGATIPSTQLNGSIGTGAIYGATSYTLTAYGNGGPVSKSITINTSVAPSLCTIQSFTGPSYTVGYGNTATLSWSVSNCTNVMIAGLSIPSNQFSGSVTTGALYNSTSYTLTASGVGSGTQTQTISVNVQPYQNQTCSIAGFNGPSQVSNGSSATLTWTTSNCSYVTVSGPGVSYGGTQPVNGSISAGPLYNSTNYYTLTAYSNSGNSVTQNLTVTTYNYQQQSCSVSSFYASPTYVSQGGSTTLVWNTYGCNSVTISGGNIGSYTQQLSGSTNTGAIYGSTTYTLTAYNNYGSPITQSVTVTTDGGSNYQSAPIVTTNQATNIQDSSATVNGYVSSNSNYYNCSYYSCGGSYSYYFQYGTSQYGLTSQTQTLSGTYGSPVTAYLTGLNQNQTYYFRLVAYNNYGTNYGSTLSFVTSGGVTVGTNIVTSIATNVSTTTARLNGIVVAPVYTSSVQAYFEYGTTLALGSSTSMQTITPNNVMNFFDGIYVSPNTVYYFRAVGTINGVTYKGATVSFTTPSTTTNVIRTVVTTAGTGGGSTLIMLTIDSQFENVTIGDTVMYNVNYKNISGGELKDATLNVILPSGVTFKQSTMGVLTTSNTVATHLGTIPKDATGTMTIQAIVDHATRGDTLLATANLAFTTSGNTQDSVVAYEMNTVANNQNSSLTGLAFFGGNFFPTTLLGWVLLIGLIILIIIIIRRISDKPAQPVPAHSAHAPVHHVDNLPH